MMMKARQKAKTATTVQGGEKDKGKGVVAREVTVRRDEDGAEEGPDDKHVRDATANTAQESGLLIHDDD